MEVLQKAYIVSPYNDDRGTFRHTGVDLLSGTSNRGVRAVARGKVIEVQNRMEDSQVVNEKNPVNLWAGNYVVLEHGNGYISRYNHLEFNSIIVKVGDIVEEGQEFSKEGQSGFATGVHLDFEIKCNGQFINPTYYAIGQAFLPPYKDDYKIKYKGHIQNIGWAEWVQDGEVCGTVGESKRLEALQIDSNLEIEVDAHIENIGWVNYGKINKDTIIGTVGQSLRLECLRLKGNFKYSVHIENEGWTNFTKADGISTLGTVGQSLRIEAIKIMV